MELNHYALRLTPYPNTKDKTLQLRSQLPDFLQSIGAIDYLFGQEYEKNFHFHVVFSIAHLIDDDVLETFKEKLYLFMEPPKKKIGNPTYSLDIVRDLDKALSYAVKDGDYEYSQNWEDIATTSYENSHEKAHSLKRSLDDISTAYITDKINDRQLWISLGQSRADLGLPLSIKWIEEMTLSIQCRKDPDKLQSLWEDIEIKKSLRN